MAAIPAWPQSETSASSPSSGADDGLQMRIPPSVSVEGYPTNPVSEQRSNYLSTGLIVSTGFNSNVLAGASSTPVSDASYTIWPTITLDQTTPRAHRSLTYSPGMTFYQPTSSLNEVDHNADLDFQFRLRKYTSIVITDSLQKSSNVLNQADPLAGTSASGSQQGLPIQLIPAIANRLSNTTDVGFACQFGRNDMVGIGGTASELIFFNAKQTPGFYNAISRGGSGFLSHRLSESQYFGASYQDLWTTSTPVDASTSSAHLELDTQTQGVLLFYTVSLGGKVSASLAVGPQHFDAAARPGSTTYGSWTVSSLASADWMGSRAVVSGYYMRTVTGGIGVLGAFESNSANASVRWMFAKSWNIGSTAAYAKSQNLAPQLPSSVPGGHTLQGSLTIQHELGQHLKAELGYAHLHQVYSGVAVIAAAPDSDRVYGSITYQFTRPLGR